MMIFLYPLTETLDLKDFGGKASGLSKIISFGLHVPRGFAIHKRGYEYYIAKNELPQELLNELNEKLQILTGEKLIVRSSAIGEDADDFSFAGQLDSFVVENKIASVVDGVKKCWASLQGNRAKAYQNISGNLLTDMGVVIQEFVEADYSGVLFTKSPYNKSHIYTEYVKGGAEPLVSGKVTPDSFSATSEMELIPEKTLPFNHKVLLKGALHLQDRFDKPLDIEWILSEHEFFFVQARPIKSNEKERVFWTNTNLNENYPTPISPLLYSIARDSYYHYFKNISSILLLGKESIRKLEYDFSNSVGIFANRIYYNMTSIHNIIAASPYESYFQDAFNKFVGYKIDDASSKVFIRKQSLFRLGARLLFLNFSLASHVKEIESKVSDFDNHVTKAKTLKELSLCFYEFLDLRFNQWYHASLADLFSMIHYKLLGSLTKRVYGEDHAGVHNGLIQAIPGLISNQPLFASWKILKEIESVPGGKDFFMNKDSKLLYSHISKTPEWEAVHKLVVEYLKNWGFRCSGELMFTIENYIESPHKFIELLQLYFNYGQDDPKVSISKKDNERRALLRTSIRKIFSKRHILFPLAIFESVALILLARSCRKAILSREQVRYKQAQMYYNFKKVVVQIGLAFKSQDIIEDENDIFFLEYKEIGSLLASSNMFAGNIAEMISIRKVNYETESANTFPESFETVFGERPIEAGDYTKLVTEGKEHAGLAASGGKVRARVKVLMSVMEAEKIKTGEILVTKQTDPGWAMVFPIIGGLIVEKGGALSHGAIVAREFGIPAVLGIENITEILRDNDEVVLDGDRGTITIL
jgi:rifampicin phosphotransferase